MSPFPESLNRREFIAGSIAAGAVGAVARADEPKKLPRRKLGRTGLEVSVIGFGTEILDALDIPERLIEAGVNYIDTAPMYQRGGAERKIAPVLKRHRDKLILSAKWYPKKDGTGTKEFFLQSFEESCERMEVEGVDIIQIHDCRTPTTINSPGGYEAFQELKAQGRAKWYGFSTHVSLVKYGSTKYDQPSVIRKGIELGWYDMCLAAFNFMVPAEEAAALKEAHDAGLGVLTMKAVRPLTDHNDSWCPKVDPKTVTKLKGANKFQESIRWNLSHDFISGVLLSMKNFDEVEQDLAAAMTVA